MAPRPLDRYGKVIRILARPPGRSAPVAPPSSSTGPSARPRGAATTGAARPVSTPTPPVPRPPTCSSRSPSPTRSAHRATRSGLTTWCSACTTPAPSCGSRPTSRCRRSTRRQPPARTGPAPARPVPTTVPAMPQRQRATGRCSDARAAGAAARSGGPGQGGGDPYRAPGLRATRTTPPWGCRAGPQRDRDVVSGDDDARDPMKEPKRSFFRPLPNSGHGTSTASVIVGPGTDGVRGGRHGAPRWCRSEPLRASCRSSTPTSPRRCAGPATSGATSCR